MTWSRARLLVPRLSPNPDPERFYLVWCSAATAPEFVSLCCPVSLARPDRPVATPGNDSINSTMTSMCKKCPPQKRFFSRMQLDHHATRPRPQGASCLVQAMSVWSVKTRHAPSPHCRNARVYGHTTTAMHDMSTPPPVMVLMVQSRNGARLPEHGITLHFRFHYSAINMMLLFCPVANSVLLSCP